MDGELDRTSENEYLQKAEIDFLMTYFSSRCKDQLNDHVTSMKNEHGNLKFLNTLLAKRLQENKKDLEDSVKKTKQLESVIGCLRETNTDNDSAITNLMSQNEILQSELENEKPKNQALASELDKMVMLYWCSEKEKYIATKELLDKEENIRQLKNVLHSLQKFLASQNEAKRHKNESNEEDVQTSMLTDLEVESEVTDIIAHISSLIPDKILAGFEPLNEGKKQEISAAQSINKDTILLEEEVMGLVGKAGKFCEEFEAIFEEKRSCLMTKLTSCDDQVQVLKKVLVNLSRLEKEKLELLDILKEMNGIMSNYRKQLDRVQGEIAEDVKGADALTMKSSDFERKVKLLLYDHKIGKRR